MIAFRNLATLLCLVLVGCAVPADFVDGDRIDANGAYVLIRMHYPLRQMSQEPLLVGLTRLDSAASRTDLVMLSVKPDQPAVFKVPPGYYYVRAVHALRGYYKHTLDPRLTLFQAKQGQVNYPGDLSIRVSTSNVSYSGTALSGSSAADYTIEITARNDPQVVEVAKLRFPALLSTLPLQFTKLTDSMPQDRHPDSVK